MLFALIAFTAAPLALSWLAKVWGPRAFTVGALLPLAAFAHAVTLAPTILAGGEVVEALEWIPSLGISLTMRMDLLSWIMTLIVTGVGALVLLYCRWYFAGKSSGLALFSGVLLAFSGAMYGLVLTDDIVVLVMFWELTSILSYLLIGHYHTRGTSRRAAMQALLVTTLGGLVMFIGVVLLVVETGTTSISEILELAPEGPLVSAALVMLLVGALSKSAIFPFHFWLPGAMAAPTPVSAYLHAAAMVKAGIYLLARFSPDFGDADPWRPIVVGLGVFTMLLGGMQALRETDLKRILAFGTVSQLGMLTTVIGFGTRDTMLAGLALLLSHALFKAALFLIVGIIDRQLATRDITELSGLWRQAPVMAVTSIVAVGAMVGLPPTLGFVGKETALSALLGEAMHGSPWGWVALVGILLGSVLTTAYGIRFIWGAFGTKKDADGAEQARTQWPDPPMWFIGSPLILAGLVLASGCVASLLDPVLQVYATTAPAASAGIAPPDHALHLALWHGFEPALFLSMGVLALGALTFWGSIVTGWSASGRALPFTATDAYNAVIRTVDRVSIAVTRLTQRGSLPVYVGTIFVVLMAAEGTALLASREWQMEFDAWHDPVQLIVAPLMIIAGILAVRARKRYTAVVLVSVTGLGMVTLFAVSGAPDLALTQILVETVTLVAFALVLRRIPSRLGSHNDSVWPIARAVLAISVGITMAVVVLVATGARTEPPISASWADLAYQIGHGKNVVNVALVDLRGWDTMGELSVLILAATGVASLVFVTNRADLLSQTKAVPESGNRRDRRPLVETTQGITTQTAANTSSPRAWLISGMRVRPEYRSLMLEVIVRILFHTIIVVSLYVLLAGHNLPGGGFAGGLIAGMALVMRYVAGGRHELGAAAPTDAGTLLGVGMTLAVGCAIVPLLFGEAPLTSTYWEFSLPLLGEMEFVTSTIFDVGVYLVVIGLVLDVLRSLGAEVDRQMKDELAKGATR